MLFFARFLGFCALLVLGLSGCTSLSGITEVKDSGPQTPLDVSHIPDAVPRNEPRTIAGNKSPYTVLGKTYRVMDKPDGFRQSGYASWYGYKFHGQRTSNGEIYDMYAMTAAHKTLPIPCYVRVTNRDNGRSVIVRVNDRGPFHEGRIIDLSYTAAAKLGFVKFGTAPVDIEVISPATTTPAIAVATGTQAAVGVEKAPTPVSAEGHVLPANTFLQAGAYSSQQAAQQLGEKITRLVSYPVNIKYSRGLDNLYRVHIGPIVNSWELIQIRELLQKNQLPVPHVVYD